MKITALILSLLLLTPTFAALPGADMLSDVIMKELDRDFDGKIDANEWKDGTDDGFVEIDHDLDGFDTTTEIETLSEPLADDLGKIGASICVTLIEKMFMTLDKDGDHRISKAEYEDGAGAIFKRLDTNHDDALTKAELNELPTTLLKGKD
jgi:Ca2+-binding EF-hand superfamily protein